MVDCGSRVLIKPCKQVFHNLKDKYTTGGRWFASPRQVFDDLFEMESDGKINKNEKHYILGLVCQSAIHDWGIVRR